jgi:pimeloyl-ACP methyl ester carboxylesterase
MMAAAIGNRNEGQRVRRLILVAPVNPWSPHGRHLAPFLSDRLVSGALAWTMPNMSFSYGAVLRRLYGDPRRIAPGTLEGYTKPYTDASSFEYGFRVLSTWNEDLANLEDAIPEIAELPVLLIWGSLDRAVLPESAAILGRHFRNADLVMLEGVGHLPYEEMPEAFNAAVIKFLSEGSRR